MITDDELAVLIMRACSSRNLFIKHHVMKEGRSAHLAICIIMALIICLYQEEHYVLI